MVNEQPRNQGVVLNFLPVTLSAYEIAGFNLIYEDETQLRRLQDQYKGRYLLRRARRRIEVVPLLPDRETLGGEPCVFSTREDWGLFEKLLEEGVRRFLHTRYSIMNVPEYGPILIKAEGEKNDLFLDALAHQKDALTKLGFIHIYRKYFIAASHLRRNLQEEPLYGVLIRVSTDWQIRASVAELVSKGVNVLGCYVVPLKASQKELRIGHKTVGCIGEINGADVRLFDFRDQEVVDARQYTIEASLENVTRCVNALLGQQGPTVMRLVRTEVGKLMNAEGQLQRIEKISDVLSQNPILCAEKLDASVTKQVLTVDAQSPCIALTLNSPKYTLKYGREPVDGPIATALSQGPFDRDSLVGSNNSSELGGMAGLNLPTVKASYSNMPYVVATSTL
jgi:hypothetical protein